MKKFVAMMNDKAVELGCSNTHFATPNGLDADLDHYTTARDMSKIACYAWKKISDTKIVKTRTKTIQNLKGEILPFGSTKPSA